MKKDNTQAVLQKIRLFRKNCADYAKDEKTLIGFSGGADSVTLLHSLITVLGKDAVCAVHINHMLRGADADGDEAFCRDFCERYGIGFHSVRVDIRKLYGETGFEEAARNERYRIFAQTAAAFGCTSVSLAHTASDNLETMIFHLCRGAGATGLSGIPPVRALGELTVKRPLIDVSREEILGYVEENGLTFRTDSTNADTAYTRNFIRAEIVPLLKKVNPAAEKNARESAKTVAELQELAQSSADAFLEKYSDLPIKPLSALAAPVLYAVLNRVYRHYGGNTLPHSQAESLSSLIFNQKTGASLSLSGGITARLDGDFLRFFKTDEIPIAVPFEQSLTMGENRLDEKRYLYIGKLPPLTDCTVCLRAEIAEDTLPFLFARNRKDGESYRFGGMTRKLKKLLCGKTVSEKNRPVICDADGILWMPGFPVADGKNGKLMIYYIEK